MSAGMRVYLSTPLPVQVHCHIAVTRCGPECVRIDETILADGLEGAAWGEVHL